MIDVAEAIDAEAETLVHKPVTSAGGVWTDTGRWIPNSVTPVSIRATMQPAGGQISGTAKSVNGRTLMDLPEGIRQEAKWLAWSRVDIAVGDEIQYRSIWYRVIFAWPRALDGFVRVAVGELA